MLHSKSELSNSNEKSPTKKSVIRGKYIRSLLKGEDNRDYFYNNHGWGATSLEEGRKGGESFVNHLRRNMDDIYQKGLDAGIVGLGLPTESDSYLEKFRDHLRER